MPAEPRWVTSMDLVRARNVVSSLPPLKQLDADDAESVAKAIAQCFAKGASWVGTLRGHSSSRQDFGTPESEFLTSAECEAR